MDKFIANLPKIELHAHLNGSLCTKSIQELGLQIYGENSESFLSLAEKFTHFSDGDKLEDCFQKFAFMHELTATKKGLKLATEMVVRDFALDNVIYLELRTTPKVNDNMTRREYLNIIVEAIERMSKEYNILVKLLVSIDRSQSVQVAEEILQEAAVLKATYPQIVKGMDLSGNPAKGVFKDFRHILKQAKSDKFSLALHCGELFNESEAQEMLDFDFDRCGHGTYLTDIQLEQCCRQNITIECCLTSNVKCGTVKSYGSHHFVKVLEKNVKAVLCTDDSGVFSTTLSNEFVIACKNYDLSRSQVHQLCINAIEASFANAPEKTELRSKVDEYFEANCNDFK